MTSKLSQRASSILAACGIGILLVLIVLLWVLVGHGTFKKSTTNEMINVVNTQQDSENSRIGLNSIEQDSDAGLLDRGKEVGVVEERDKEEETRVDLDTELVRPMKMMSAFKTDETSVPLVRHHSGHFRHRQAEVWDPHPEYEVPAFGTTLHLVLAHNNKFLSPNLQILHVWTNFTQRIKSKLQSYGCYYTGKVKGVPDSDVAVSLCGGMTGYIRTRGDSYYIEPAEKFHNVTTDSILHRIHKITGRRTTTGHNIYDESCDADVVSKTILDDANHIKEHLINKRETKYFATGPDLGNFRSENREYYIEILVVADKKMVEYHETDENLHHYILTLMSHVALLYKDATIGNPISMVVVGIRVLKDKMFADHSTQYGEDVGVDSGEMLKQFCQFQKSINAGKGSQYHHDTALLLTRETLCRHSVTNKCDTLGLAEVGTMCNPYSSCAVIKDKGLSTSYTIAHELGHVLSMPHDDDVKCNRFHSRVEMNNIMSRMMQNDTKPWLWSACSKHFLTEFLESDRAHCLLDSPKEDMLHFSNESVSLPGETFSGDRQCELVFGPGATQCTYMRMCGPLWCSTHENDEGCSTKYLPTADGTPCEEGRWCHRGECVALNRGLLQPVTGGWSAWRKWSECSRTCGGGVRRAERACDSPRPANGGPYCVGHSVRYVSCNTDPCDLSTPDFREDQCAAFNGNTRGIPNLPSSVVWVPKYDGVLSEEVCMLYCSVHHAPHSYFLLADKVIDGTKCGRHSFGICVNGICRPGGCDNRLDSDLTLDECGVCGGDNSRCEEITGHYNIPSTYYGYHKVARIPRGSCSIDIRQHGRAKDDNYLALVDSATGEYILNGNFVISSFPKLLLYAGVSIEYSGSKAAVERINSSNSIQLKRDLIVELLSAGRLLPPNITYSYKMTRGSGPTHSWQLYGEWSACSSVCSGTRHVIPRCVDTATGVMMSDDLCAHLEMDGARSKQDCNMHCVLSWKVKSRRHCSAECGAGVREIIYHCVRVEQAVAADSSDRNDVQSLLEHHQPTTSELAEEVQPWAEPVDSDHCIHMAKPSQYEHCQGRCHSTRWRYEKWSDCTKTCGSGLQTRNAKCVDSNNNVLDNAKCANIEKLTEQTCNMQRCPTWSLGDWTPCSVSCGKGYRTKPYYCHLDGQILNPEYCDIREVPMMKEDCLEKPCVHWISTDWTHCSVSCGIGYQKRDVFCENADGKILNNSLCKDLRKPAASKICHLDKCSVTSTFKPISNEIDNSINPISDSYKFDWRSGPWSECSRSCAGGVLSRQVACQNEAGVLFGEHKCDSSKKPLNKVQCNSMPCPTWNYGAWSECDRTCSRHRQVICQDHNGAILNDENCASHERPARESQCEDGHCSTGPAQEVETSSMETVALPQHGHRYRWKVADWSQCSKSCGRGVKTRHASCTDTINNVTLVDHFCRKLKRPKTHRNCFKSDCSYVWVEGAWTKCTQSCGEGMMYRNVTCHRVGPGGAVEATPVREHHHHHLQRALYCAPDTKPSSYTTCLIRYCNEVYSWSAGPWRECSHPCGKKGRQIRHLYCYHQDGKKVQRNHCSQSLKPQRKKKCNQRKSYQYLLGQLSKGHRSRVYEHVVQLWQSAIQERYAGVFQSCRDVKQRLRTSQDREYELLVRNKRIHVYCYGMNTDHPIEYISLPTEGRENYAEIFDKRLIDPESCPYGGERREDCACAAWDGSRAGLTLFSRVRLNTTTLRIDPEDFRFSRQVRGARVPFGTAGDCYSARRGCPQGRFSVDLDGTGLRLARNVKWVAEGVTASLSVNQQQARASGKCGGYCGYCRPDPVGGLQLDVVS